MAEGGINAALNTKDENDSPEEHFTDTIKAACGLADPNAVWGMTQAAPCLLYTSGGPAAAGARSPPTWPSFREAHRASAQRNGHPARTMPRGQYRGY